MARNLADILSSNRKELFTGRDKEIGIFSSILQQPILNVFLIYIYGPGGQGKTTLIKQFAEICCELDVSFLKVDGREINASPLDFTRALQQALNTTNIFDSFNARNGKFVLFIDTYELLNPIDDWLRDEFLPKMPDNILTVLSGRNAPDKNWTLDNGWQQLMKVIQVRNFSPNESRSYLKKRSVPLATIDSILEFTHGHPLALSVVADMYDQHPERPFNPAESPDVIKTLLENFVQKVPGPAHRTALEICAMIKFTSESLLKEVMEIEDASELFKWLQDLSFIEKNRFGLYPHDLAREAIVTDLMWRNPEWNKTLHKRIRKFYIDRLNNSNEVQQRELLYQLAYLHRHHSSVRPFLEWQEGASNWIEPLKEEDIPQLVQIVKQNEGKQSSLNFSYWVRHPASFTWVFRNATTKCSGFILRVNVNELDKNEQIQDKAISQIINYVTHNLTLRKGEVCTVFRFWMSVDSYQQVSRLQSSIFLTIVQFYLTTPSLAVHFLGCAKPKFWEKMLNYADLHYVPELSIQNEKDEFGFYMHDWRQTPPAAWLDLLGQREVGEKVEGNRLEQKLQIVVLSEDEFTSCVYDALKDYHSDKKLLNNPLLRSRFVINAANNDTDPKILLAALRDCLADATDKIKNSPKDVKLHRVMFRTFLNPVGSQEAVADYLNIPFSTFRRYLRKAVNMVTETLWALEIEK
ncbi:MAG: AAA family ATPase [Chitinophagales bacterium]|nr:AAA family ATPase [Chitinophagales bacterium]